MTVSHITYTRTRICMHAWVRVNTFQHAKVHGIIGSLWHAEHDLQAIFDFSFALLATCQKFLHIQHNDTLENAEVLVNLYCETQRTVSAIGDVLTLSSSWYLVILCTGLIR